jgi:hypothetical protein
MRCIPVRYKPVRCKCTPVRYTPVSTCYLLLSETKDFRLCVDHSLGHNRKNIQWEGLVPSHGGVSSGSEPDLASYRAHVTRTRFAEPFSS